MNYDEIIAMIPFPQTALFVLRHRPSLVAMEGFPESLASRPMLVTLVNHMFISHYWHVVQRFNPGELKYRIMHEPDLSKFFQLCESILNAPDLFEFNNLLYQQGLDGCDYQDLRYIMIHRKSVNIIWRFDVTHLHSSTKTGEQSVISEQPLQLVNAAGETNRMTDSSTGGRGRMSRRNRQAGNRAVRTESRAICAIQ